MILRKKRIPLASPDNFDDVPTGSSKEGLKFLDDLAVTSYWTIKALQVGVDDEGQIIQTVVGSQLECSAAFDFVKLTITQECPHVLF